jgi:hypothetical protein
MEILIRIIQEHIELIIAAGIVAALTICWKLLASIATSIFSPVPIQGNWETRLDRGTGLEKHEDATVHQFINRVWGPTTDTDGTRFRFRGAIVGDRVCWIFRARSPANDFGADFLKIMAGGKKMKGYEIGIDRDSDQPKTYTYEWSKKP